MRQEQAKGNDEVGATNYYQQKYKHILGGLECAKESAVKMEPNKKFGYGKTPGRDGHQTHPCTFSTPQATLKINLCFSSVCNVEKLGVAWG